MLPALVPCLAAPALYVLPPADEPHDCSWDEADATFGTTPARRARLHAARARLELLTVSGLPLLAAWLNGSFVTSKPDPKDVDVVVLIDGDRATRELGPTEAGDLVDAQDQYEPGGTADSHLTDFHFVWWYPEEHRLGKAAADEMDYWFRLWSRVEVGAPTHTGERLFVEDSKGFAEVRW